MSIVREFVNLFSTRAVIKSNILSTNFTPIGSGGSSGFRSSGMSPQKSNFSAFQPSRFVNDYVTRIDELMGYEQTEIVNTAVGVYKDFVSNYFTESDEIVTFMTDDPEDKKIEAQINAIFKQIGYKDETKDHLEEIINYGSYSFKVDWNKVDRKWVRYELQNPYSVITVNRDNAILFHLVLTRDRKLVQVAPNAIVRIGRPLMHLINDLGDNVFDVEKKDQDSIVKEDTIVNRYDMASGFPLFYNIMGKLKEYILKDQMITLLSIKDLIQPLLLLIRVDNKTDPTEANRLAVNTEELINKYSDLSAIFGANFSINDLLDSILNNIRVLPDYQSVIGDMNSVDLSKVTQKIQDIMSSQDNSKESLFNSIGIPRALFGGDTTKWEAIKGSQRLNSRVASLIGSINGATIDTAAMFYYLLTKKSIDKNVIRSNIFTKTDVDYNNALIASDIVNQLMESINRVLEGAQRFTQENKMIDIEAYCEWLRKQLKIIDPDIMDFITDEKLKEFVKAQIKAQKENESGGFGGGGGFGRFSNPTPDDIVRSFSEATYSADGKPKKRNYMYEAGYDEGWRYAGYSSLSTPFYCEKELERRGGRALRYSPYGHGFLDGAKDHNDGKEKRY